VPALRAMRANAPEARISLVGLPATRPLVERFDRYVDEFIDFPGFPGLPELEPDLPGIPRFIANLQKRRFDLAINLHGFGIVTTMLAYLFGATRVAGYHRRGEWRPDQGYFLTADDAVPEVRRWLDVCRRIGWSATDETLEFPIDEAAAMPSVPTTGAKPLVVVHPGASVASRRWPARSFAAVADALAAAGASIVLTGTAEERQVTWEVGRSMRGQALDLSGRTNLDGLASFVRDAALVVCNDTGISHVADALGTPSVVLFTDSEVDRWAPADVALHRRIAGGSAAATNEAVAISEALDLLERHRQRPRRRSDAA
jgi:ADP-heptose:LPS heptosyltransferase